MSTHITKPDIKSAQTIHTQTAVSVRQPLFGRLGVVGLTLLLLFAFFASQLVGLYIAAKAILPQAENLNIDQLMIQGGEHGTVVGLSVLLCFASLTLLTFFIVGRKVKHSRALFDYLGLRKFSPRQAIQGLALLLIFIVISEVLSQLLGRTPMDFVDPLFDSMSSGGAKWLLIIVIVIIAPIYEELIFRGVLWQAIADLFTPKKGAMVASVVTSVIFAAIHLQYGLFEISTIAVLALIFCYARIKSNSLLLPIILHIANNGAAMALYLAYGSGA